MPDGGYKSLDGFAIELVTETSGKNIKNQIIGDQHVDKLSFPRLRLASFPEMGYKGSDFKAIANMIKPGLIDVYRTKTDHNFRGRYVSTTNNDNFYMLVPDVVDNPRRSMKTIIHETTHAIQDWKQWRETALDREVDAHFAAALYMVHAGVSTNDTVMTYFTIGAEAYAQDKKEVRSRWFGGILQKMKAAVQTHYQAMHKQLHPNEDPAKFLKNFNDKQRMDGIG